MKSLINPVFLRPLVIDLICCLPLLYGCQKNNVLRLASPEQAILGKWKIMAANDLPYEASGYTEYLPDSLAKHIDYNVPASNAQDKYWLKDTVLYQGIVNDKVFLGVKFKYEFSNDYNRLKLTFIDIQPIINSLTFKRID